MKLSVILDWAWKIIVAGGLVRMGWELGGIAWRHL